MFTLNVGFLGCNGERGKEKSKVNFNFPVLQIYGRFIFSFYSIPGFMPSDRFAWNDPVRLSFTDRGNSSQARQTPPVGRSENLTGSSFLLQWSSATNPCIFCLYYSSKEGEEKEIRKPLFHSVPVFQIKISFPCSDNGSLRCSCSGTIGALASVVLLFLNDRPMVSERSEFRRSVKEKAR